EDRNHADRRLPVFLRLHRVRRAVASEARRLLCVLLLRLGALPAHPSGWVAGVLAALAENCMTGETAEKMEPQNSRGETLTMLSNVERYQRIAPLSDLLDLPFEHRRYHSFPPL